MSHAIDATRTVAELATEIPGAAALFDRTGIDFCCGGQRSLGAACKEKGLDPAEILAALQFGQSLPSAGSTDEHWRREPVAALMAHIVETHHAYVRTAVPRLQGWLEKALAAHGARHPELFRIRHSFSGMASEMAQHMAKEELILFPSIRRAAAAGSAPGSSLTPPVRMMMAEHDHTGRDLAEIRAASGDFAIPPDSCGTYRALYAGLEEFEANMRQHVHLESNILFPRARALESPHADPAPVPVAAK